MGQRQKEWAKRARIALIEELGGCCIDCGSTRKLEFDCEITQGDEHHKMDTSARICFYRKQYSNGNLKLRCKTDHKLKTQRENSLARAVSRLVISPPVDGSQSGNDLPTANISEN